MLLLYQNLRDRPQMANIKNSSSLEKIISQNWKMIIVEVANSAKLSDIKVNRKEANEGKLL